jgi:hypothetical protein
VKIASVTNHNSNESVGGGYIPAVAFRDWCVILGHECDLIHYMDGCIDVINKEYDALFISNPTVEIKACEIDIPYVVMIHAEFDKMYDVAWKDDAKSMITIDKDQTHWQYDEEIFWHPCTLPSLLIKGDEHFKDGKNGTIYAARLSTWKNANTLMAYSNMNIFQDEYGPVHIYGKANNEAFGEFCDSVLSDVERIPMVFDIHDMQRKLKHYKYFWDVSGNLDYTLNIKRLNLAAFEAMKQGCIPIVDKGAIPEELHPYCIDFRDIGNAFAAKPKDIRDCQDSEYFTYESVKKQIIKILKVLE